MKELLLELDGVNSKIKSCIDENGNLTVDDKWLMLFDHIIVEIIKSRRVLDFVRDKKEIDWDFVLEAIKKAREG